MVTYAHKKKSNQYITADTEQGEKILKYLKSRCEKALNYCQEQGLTAVEDFAEAVEELTEADGKPGISVKVTQGGFVLSLTDRPEYGSTTGKYMMEHLGEPDDNRFTAVGIKATLTPEKSKSQRKNKPSDLDELLSEIEETDSVPKQASKASSNAKKKLELDEFDEDHDLLDEINGSEPTIKTKAKSQTKSNNDWEIADSRHSKSQAKSKITEVEVDEEFVVDDLEEEDKKRIPKTKSQAKPKTKNVEKFVTAEIDEEEELALPQQVKPKSRQDEEEFAGATESHNQFRSKKLNQNPFETVDSVDDLLEDTLTKSPTTQSLPSDANPRTQRRKKSNELDIDSLLKTGAQTSERIATSGNEINGTTLSGLSAQAAFLATLVGIDAAQKVIGAAREAGQEHQVTQLIKRLKSQSQRADRLTERANHLPALIDEQEASIDEQESENTPLLPLSKEEHQLENQALSQTETSESVGAILAKAVNHVTHKLKTIPQPDDEGKKINPIEINTNASFEEQLKQINQALDRLEKRLDTLESRIETLEKALQQHSLSQTPPAAEVMPEENNDDFVKPTNGGKHSLSPENQRTDARVPAFAQGRNPLATENSTPPSERLPSTDEALIAEALVQIYHAAVEEAAQYEGDHSQATPAAANGGVDLGNTKLYVFLEGELTTVTLETKDGFEVFEATSDETRKWNVTADKLTPKDKQEILKLPHSLEEFQQVSNQEHLALLVAERGKDAISLTDSQGNKFEFEAGEGIVTGYTEHGEVIYEAILQPDQVEVLQCDIPGNELESWLEERRLQQTPTSNSHRETHKANREVQI
ncbi:hypothetical protein [Microcoleus sp. D3_18_C4]|uniref:hypothetical protein n=1 Tax=Microcoleus sp. D3_18_C4 TaxID=3055335 RepID=UPI002FCEC080